MNEQISHLLVWPDLSDHGVLDVDIDQGEVVTAVAVDLPHQVNNLKMCVQNTVLIGLEEILNNIFFSNIY